MWYSLSEHLRGVHIAGEKLFQIGEGPQLLEWEEYGFRMQVPEGATSGPCDFAVKAIIAGQFEFPEDTELVSAVYAISASRRLNKPVTLEIEHCVRIENERNCDYLTFGIARCDQHPLPYTFTLLEDGKFLSKSCYGIVFRSSFSLVGVLKYVSFPQASSSPSHEAETGSAEESSLVTTPPQATPIHGGDSSEHPSYRPLTQMEELIPTGFNTEDPESPAIHISLPDGHNGANEVEKDSAVSRTLLIGHGNQPIVK